MSTLPKLRFIPFNKAAFTLLVSSALSLFLVGHRFVMFLEKSEFYPSRFADSEFVFWVLLLVFQFMVAGGTYLLIRLLENRFKRRFENDEIQLIDIGAVAVKEGVSLTVLPALAGFFYILIDLSLLNPWDLLFFAIFLALYYTGIFMHFYYSVTLAAWETSSSEIELERLKMEYDKQKMWLRTFLWITLSFLVSQVFVALKMKFEVYMEDTEENSHMLYVLAINVLQIVFLVLVMWTSVFSQVLRRMEEVQICMRDLGMREK